MSLRWLSTVAVLLVLAAGACGDDGDKSEDGGGGGGSGGTGEDAGIAAPEDAGTDAAVDLCGNGEIDSELEQCDDGNSDDDDGCTGFCTFTCEKDEDCDDLDICNGAETCKCTGAECALGDRVCLRGKKAEDGTRCGTAMSCQDGECLPDDCGDGVLQEDEECDDGDNWDEDDGCTTRCTFSCVPDDPERACTNPCNPTSVCDEEKHACTAGDPLPDDAICNDGEGYCVDGVCVASDCGDGNQEPNEQCDLGDRNGEPDSGCTGKCTLATCGDGKIEGMEQCDDGKHENADGCDAKCRVEAVYRLTRLEISLDPAPPFCTFAGNPRQGNSFKDLFLGPSLLGNTLYTMMVDMMSGVFSDGSANVLVHVLDLEDPSVGGVDPLVGLGLSMGELGAEWESQTDKLDFPVLVNRGDVDDDNIPLTVNPAEVTVEGQKTYFRSTVPQMVFFRSPGGDFILHSTMTEFEVDPARSAPKPPPDLVASLLLPESLGRDYEDKPQGIICGAMLASTFEAIPMPAELAGICLLNGFKACEEGQDPTRGECDSIMTLLKEGCVGLLSPIGEPDADADGDGVNDAYSSLVKASARRVKLVGVAEPQSR